MRLENLITSRQNPTVKRICALSEKKKRYAEGLFRFDGIKLFCEAIRFRLSIDTVVVCEDSFSKILPELEAALQEGAISEGQILFVSESVFEKISDERAPEGIITVARFLEQKHKRLTREDAREYHLPRDQRILIAEAIRDAGNLGTVIRSCAALGIERLLLSDDCADLYNPKTIRAAMGGLFALEIDIFENSSLADAIASLRGDGRKIYATALHRDARKIGDLALERGDAFVIGNEGHGLTESIVEVCDGCAIIPMSEHSESLNAAAAAAICIWETAKA